MRVFITGASGHIASAVIPELLTHGHEVVGLARSEESAAAVEALGAQVHRGDLTDLDGLAAGAAGADGVIHLAFRHDLMMTGDYMTAATSDLEAIKAMGAALEGSGKPFVGTGGTLMLTFAGITGREGTEHDTVAAGPRVDSENAVVAMAASGIRSSIVRLAPLVHSDLDHHGFGPAMIAMAREHGSAAYIGDGSNRWPAFHTLDAGVLYRLALEKAPAGSRLHGVGDAGVPFKEIAQTIASNLGVEAISVSAEQAPQHLGFLAAFGALDNPTSNAITRELLEWEPAGPGLIEDMNAGHYFAQAA